MTGHKSGNCPDAIKKDELDSEKNPVIERIIDKQVTDTDTSGKFQVHLQLSDIIQKSGYTLPEQYLSKIVDVMTCHAATETSKLPAFLIPVIKK